MWGMTIPSHAELLREYLEQLSQPGAESRLLAWTDWVRLRSVGGAVAIGAALMLAGCDDSDSGNGNGNVSGAAGTPSTTGTGGLNMTALYAAPMTGGTAATTTDAGGAGGISAGTRYAVPLGGSGGQDAAQGGTNSATGGASMGALYMAPMEKSIPSVGPVSK